MPHASAQPIPFDPSQEEPEPDEATISAEIVDTMRTILDTTFADRGRAIRSVHAKSHGLLGGTITIPADLPVEYAQGAFARPGRHDILLRFSTNAGDILDDSITLPRGLAIKILDVEGEALPGHAGKRTQDFVLVNGPVFMARDARQFLGSLKLLAKTTDTPQGWKKAFSAAFRGIETALEAVGGESSTLKSLGGHPMTHPLGETFYTQVPHLYGPYVAKLSVVPVAPDLVALKGAFLDVRGRPDGLREAFAEHFRSRGGEWELRVQLRTDPETMPIEDATKLWPEAASPYVTVGRITVPPQTGWSEALSGRMDDCMAFSPWHGLAAHRPLGRIMRARKPAYEASAGFRASHNGCPMLEPRRAAEVVPAG
ncbi:MAG: hypothetical protein JWR08_2671 [Enterovirga sp.]|nr:hypothetical protein [Enterovirga sp.]